MESNDIKKLINLAKYHYKALSYIEENLNKRLYEVLDERSSYGKYTSIEHIDYEEDRMIIKVFDCGSDIYDHETVTITYKDLVGEE